MRYNIDDESICDKLKTRLGAYIRRCSRGKIKEVHEIEIMIGGNIIFLTIFTGRDHYAPWAEINVVASAQDIYDVLSNVIDVAHYVLEKCPRIMISYVWDVETMNLLDKGFHPAATKLGVLLISKGYYVVRDMYFPEGFAEGNPKIVGEKYVNNRWYIKELCDEIKDLKRLIDEKCEKKDSFCRYTESSLRKILEQTTFIKDVC